MTDFRLQSEPIFATLYSGSSGNCVYIAKGDDAILIDAGKNAKCAERTLDALGGRMEQVRAAFVTHEHSDHIAALDVLSRRYGFPVHAHIDSTCSALPANTVYHKGLIEETVGPFTVRSFYTPHDSGCSMGYTVEVDGKKFGIATDMGMLAKSVVETLCGCNAALIECNYDKEMLRCGPYPPHLKARVEGKFGHLSNEDGALLAAVLARTGASHILLGHLSKENNLPEKALEAVYAEFEKRGVSAQVLVAKREEPTLLWGKPERKECLC